MKSLARLLAGVTHPVFLPLYSLIIYWPLVAKYEVNAFLLIGVWLALAYYLFPLLHFRVIRKINLEFPDLDGRRSIYKTYSLVSLGLMIAVYFVIPEYVSFFLSGFLLHVLLYWVTALELKASWHTAAWAFLLLSSLMILYNFRLTDLAQISYSLLAILILVAVVRWRSGAHTLFELGIGICIGFIASLPILYF
jgi:hypothetical protein